MLTRFLVPLIIGFGLASCGFQEEPEARNEHGGFEENIRVAGLPGNLGAKILFVQPLKGINSREHFIVEAQFLEEDATLVLHSHFNGYKWRDGMQIRLKREERNLILMVSSPAFPPFTTRLENNILPKDFRIRLRFEVHDGVNATGRVLIWRDSISQQGTVQRPRTFLSANNADFDSSALGWTFLSHGRGVFWGLETELVQIHSAFREAPYVP